MAKRLAGRYGYPESPHEFDVTFHPDRLGEPLRWSRKDMVVFVCSMSDLFHEDVSFEQITSILGIMSASCGLWWMRTYLILTKRPHRAAEYFASLPDNNFLWPMSHVWLGVTVETQDQMWRVVELLTIPAAKHFVSIEPCLGPVDLSGVIKALDGVIVGGESGPSARPMDPDWVRSIRDACVEAGVPFTFKQHGGVNKKKTGRLLDGRAWDELPWDVISAV